MLDIWDIIPVFNMASIRRNMIALYVLHLHADAMHKCLFGGCW